MLRVAENRVTDELDLIKYIKHKRMQRLTLIASLPSYEYFLVEKMASLIIHESNDSVDDSTY